MAKTIVETLKAMEEENKKLKGRLNAVDNVLKEPKTNLTDKMINISGIIRDKTKVYREG